MSKEDHDSVPLDKTLKIISDTTTDLTQPRTVLVLASVNVLTGSDAYIYVYIDEVQAGIPFYTGVKDAWAIVPVNVLTQIAIGHHRVTLRATCAAQDGRVGTRVLTLMFLGGSG